MVRLFPPRGKSGCIFDAAANSWYNGLLPRRPSASREQPNLCDIDAANMASSFSCESLEEAPRAWFGGRLERARALSGCLCAGRLGIGGVGGILRLQPSGADGLRGAWTNPGAASRAQLRRAPARSDRSGPD